jgi:hypothetical protein
MGAPSKRARVIRESDEFDIARLAEQVSPPKQNAGAVAWSLADIFTARDQQMIARFNRPARLAESMRTDDALAVAYENRLAPQRCIPVAIQPAKGARGVPIANEAEALYGQNGIGIRAGTVGDIHGCLVNHGVAFGANTATPREDGSRVDFELKAWPIEHVRWDSFKQCFVTQTEDGEEEIHHGDGRWVVFAKNELEPWKGDAAILPAALVWARHAYGMRDWAKSSVAHGNAKIVGELPEGVPLQRFDEQGNSEGLSEEAAAFLELLKALGSDGTAGIRPAGSKTEFVSNNSSAWQIFSELVTNAEKAAARIYLGTDGTLGTQGGAPGVDIQALFGVALTKVQGDLACIERGILTGVIEPWCAINFGDSSLAPQRVYQIPDADKDARHAAEAAREQAFFASVKAAREAGFAITPEYVAELAKRHDVAAPPLPAPAQTTEAPAPAGSTPSASLRILR